MRHFDAGHKVVSKILAKGFLNVIHAFMGNEKMKYSEFNTFNRDEFIESY